MALRVDREEVRRLAADGAYVIDVLPSGAYRQLHIVGAVNIPLGTLDRKTAEELARTGRAIVVYCNDFT
jgi:rhodanese-related sulfurtransferase